MPSIAEQKIVVIGGNGSLGSCSVKAALSRGAHVTVFSRHASASAAGAAAAQGSIIDQTALREALADATGVVIGVEADRTQARHLISRCHCASPARQPRHSALACSVQGAYRYRGSIADLLRAIKGPASRMPQEEGVHLLSHPYHRESIRNA